MEKKLRVQLFDEEGRLIDDRLVSQNPELSKGPAIPHKGLFRIEFTLDSKDDIEKAKTYLDQIIGSLPLGPKKLRKKLREDMSADTREELLNSVMGVAKDQDELIMLLREQGFKFVMWDFLSTFDFETLNIKERHKNKYQWMIRCQKKARNPKSDRYDPMLIFGIQLLDEHNEKVVVYLNGEFRESFKVSVPTKPKEVFKKTGMIKFPHFMTEEEREKFRYEQRLYEADPEKKQSKFFLRWKPYVENLPKPIQDKKE